jgi:hypothetical protein
MKKIFFLLLLGLTTRTHARNLGYSYEEVDRNHGVEGVDFVIVPNLIGKIASDPSTKKLLADSGFTISIMSWLENPKVAEDTITDQAPRSGMAIKKPIPIIVSIVSPGPLKRRK